MMGIMIWLFMVYGLIWSGSLLSVRHHATILGPKYYPVLPDLLLHYLGNQTYLGHFFKTNAFIHQMSNIVSYGIEGISLAWIAWHNPLLVEPFLFYLSCLQLMRCICFNVTILPDPSTTSHLKPFWEAFLTGGVSDLIFSGHLMYVYGSILFLYRQALISAAFYHLSVCFAVLYAVALVLMRNHYTIDVLCTFAFSHFIYDIY